MKKAILLLSIYFFATGLLNVSQAQSFQWLTRMGGPDSDLNFDPDEWVRDIEVDADGNVLSYELVGRSGNADLDRATLDMIRRAQPLPKPPADMLKGGSIEIVAPFVYNIEKRRR